MDYRCNMKDKKRIIVKIGSSSLTHAETGCIDFGKLDKLARVLSNIRNMGKEVVLVSSGAVAVGKNKIQIDSKDISLAKKRACAAIGQAQLMMIYQKLFGEYNQTVAQVLMTKITISDNIGRANAIDTFNELLKMGVIPIVNENDTVSTFELQFGDNDRLSALIASITNADLLILLSDIDGLFTDDPNTNENAKFIEVVDEVTDELMSMGKSSTTSDVGTGGMATKLVAAKIATSSGADMIIANGDDVSVVEKIINGENIGTLFKSNKDEDFDMISFIS